MSTFNGYIQIDEERIFTPTCRGRRSLGGSILVQAIYDYRSNDYELQRSAAALLYPITADQQAHWEWVLSEAEGINASWLREKLDQWRFTWDARRRKPRVM